MIYVRVKLNARTYPGPKHDNAGNENEGLTDWLYLECLHNGYYLIAIAIACATYINEQLDYENHLDKLPF